MNKPKKEYIILGTVMALLVIALIACLVIIRNDARKAVVRDVELQKLSRAQDEKGAESEEARKLRELEEALAAEEKQKEEEKILAEQQLISDRRDASAHCAIDGFTFNGYWYRWGDTMTQYYDRMMLRPIPAQDMFDGYVDITLFSYSDSDWTYDGKPQYAGETLILAKKEDRRITGVELYYSCTGTWMTSAKADYTLEPIFVSGKDSSELGLAMLEITYADTDAAHEAAQNFITQYDMEGYTFKTLISYQNESYEAHVQPDGNYFAFRDNKIILVNNRLLSEWNDVKPTATERTAATTDKIYFRGIWDIQAGSSFEDIYYQMAGRGWSLSSQEKWWLMEDKKGSDLMCLTFQKYNGTYSNVAVKEIDFYLYHNRLLFTFIPVNSGSDSDTIEENCDRRYVLSDYDRSKAPEAVSWFFDQLSYWSSDIKSVANGYHLGFISKGMMSVNDSILDEYYRDVNGIDTSMNDM